MARAPFAYSETHQVTRRPGNLVLQSSEGTGWPSLFASVQTEASYEGSFPAVADHLIVVPLKHSVHFTRRIGGEFQEILLPPGSTTITPGGADFSVRTKVDSVGYETFHLYLRHSLLAETYEEMFQTSHTPPLSPRVGVRDPVVQTVVAELRDILSANEPSDYIYVESLSRTLAARLARTYLCGRSPHAKAAGILPPEKTKRAIDYIETFLDRNLTLDGIADVVDLSVARFSREFKKSQGLSPYNYILQTRVNRALYLIKSSRVPLSEIAFQCGFSHQQHMTRMVHRATGSTPGSIRRGR